jgi:hypothetical protein
MPLRPDMIFNFVRHEFIHGLCQRCSTRIQHDLTGAFWSSEGCVLKEEPVGTNWTTCKAQ